MVDQPDLSRIEHILDKLSKTVGERGQNTERRPRTSAETRTALLVRSCIQARRARDRALGADLFSDPAWCMLLDLYLRHSAGEPSSVSSLCLASGIPQSTGLRWLLMLEKAGLISRRADPVDRRRTLIDLTSIGEAKIEAVFAGVDSVRSRERRAS